ADDLKCPEIRLRWQTAGPGDRYRFCLFVEKEGFGPLLQRAAIQDRFDLALMSTKGQSVTAYRLLVDRFSARDVVFLVLHDMDASGFSILHNLRNNGRRYCFKNRPCVNEVGLRLTDALRMGLQSEQVKYGSKKKKQNKDPRINLRQCGA